ncbi:hypothetical protein CVT25_001355 [Psilocybe cyanescens]|uniref:HSF-type DNA-binding domain-containing protein n=1 Tax=Psilocybe cyanescens TaxID=93625 RepID=A0A409XEV5_PSICY|nr:hypothetical protein CVT25_001355 [Psilocybe cyanescens]
MSFNAKSGDPAFTLPGTIQLQNDGENEEQEFIMSSTVTDFARKLYNLLEDPSHNAIICWGPERDCFTVKDTTLFAKNILPRVFNHSNFASFVRQLNKYDFHKVRKESSQDLDQTWTFKHPNFHGDRPEALQHIRRKAAQGAAGERPPQDTSKAEFSSLYSYPSQLSRQPFSSNLDGMRGSKPTSMELQVELDRLRDDNEDLRTRTRTLERNYDAMGTSLLQDPALQDMISWGALRDCFVVKARPTFDPSEFLKTVLPPTFNHSNFASFVRQLNKYGFHKVKKTEYNKNGDLTWTFRHRHFHADKPEALHNVKRQASAKAPPAGASTGSHRASSVTDSPSLLPSYDSSSPSSYQLSPAPLNPYPTSLNSHQSSRGPSRKEIKAEIRRLQNEGDGLRTRLRHLERNYETMFKGLNGMESTVARQDRHLESMMQQFLENENLKGTWKEGVPLIAGTASPESPSTRSLISVSIPSQGQEPRSSSIRTHPPAQSTDSQIQRPPQHQRRQSLPQPSVSPGDSMTPLKRKRDDFSSLEQGTPQAPHLKPGYVTTAISPPSNSFSSLARLVIPLQRMQNKPGSAPMPNQGWEISPDQMSTSVAMNCGIPTPFDRRTPATSLQHGIDGQDPVHRAVDEQYAIHRLLLEVQPPPLLLGVAHGPQVMAESLVQERAQQVRRSNYVPTVIQAGEASGLIYGREMTWNFSPHLGGGQMLEDRYSGEPRSY